MEPVKLKLKVPPNLKANGNSGVCVGVDEAGRGPVLGPMVYACAFWSLADDETLQQRDYDDSKKLSEDDRKRMFEQIEGDEKIGFAIGEISARALSEQMQRTPEPVSLNKIAQDATCYLLNSIIASGVKVEEIYVDALGNCETYEKFLGERYPGAKITVKPKADSLYKVVSAASICAKYTRDYSLSSWTFREQDIEFSSEWGCGYPGDEKTKKWLVDHMDKVFGFPEFVRFSWQTTKNLLEPAESRKESSENAVKVRFALDARGSGQTITSMFKRARSSRCHYLTERNITAGDHNVLGK